MNLSKYLADFDSVGDCAGQEQAVVDKLNAIYRALDCRIDHLFIVGPEDLYDPDRYDEIMCAVWRDWHDKKAELATLSEAEIDAYVNKLCVGYHVDELERRVLELERQGISATEINRVVPKPAENPITGR